MNSCIIRIYGKDDIFDDDAFSRRWNYTLQHATNIIENI